MTRRVPVMVVLLVACKGREPAGDKTPAPSPAAPPAPVVVAVDAAAPIDSLALRPSQWPDCTAIDLRHVRDLDYVPPDAIPVIETITRALAANDPAPIEALLASRVRLDGGTRPRESVVERLRRDGPQATLGFQPRGCTWEPKAEPGTDRTWFELYDSSAGTPQTRIVRVENVDTGWRIVVIETADYGPEP